MRLPKFLTAVAVNLCLLPYAVADVAQVIDVKVVTGSYIIQPSFCIPEQCVAETGNFTGTFTATLVADKIFMSNIKIVSDTPNFKLPEDPYTAPPGATAFAKYALQGDNLAVSGFIDSRAFDGPFVSYDISATKINPDVVVEPFNPQGYFLARQDFRKCAAPQCGGIFVKKVNQALTQCADGRKRAECYVAEADWKKLGFNPFAANTSNSFNTQLLLRGKLAPSLNPTIGKLGVFYGLAAYRPANDSRPEGTFYGVESKGIVCITSPCFSLNEYTLNSRQVRTISDLDLTGVKATDADVASAYLLLGEDAVVPVVGHNKREKQLAGIGVKLVAQQFYLPLTAKNESCPEGYSESVKGCVTKHGCVFPQLELLTVSGIPIDLTSGEIIGSQTTSCVDSCDEPAFLAGPAYCQLSLPSPRK